MMTTMSKEDIKLYRNQQEKEKDGIEQGVAIPNILQ